MMCIWNMGDCIMCACLGCVSCMGKKDWIPRGWMLKPSKGKENGYFEEMEIFMEEIFIFPTLMDW